MRSVSWLAVALTAVAIAGCSDGGSAPTSTSAAPTTTTAAPTPTGDTEPPQTTVPATTTTSAPTTAPPTVSPADDLEAAAIAAFEAWVGHLAAGDHQAAWEAMAPSSRQAIGEDEFFGGTVHAMSEGWGAWAHARDVGYAVAEDEAGRTVLEISGTVEQEGMTETRTVTIPIVVDGDRVLLSPFEEFGNVAEAVREELEGVSAPPVPADSGEGRRVVYANGAQRVWLVEEDGSVVDSYLVSGRQGVPAPGSYEVFSRSETAYAGHDDITMRFMVRFAHGENLAIGFHSIPNTAGGAPLQSEEQLGEYHSAGCVRQTLAHASFLYEWAPEGTAVVVLP